MSEHVRRVRFDGPSVDIATPYPYIGIGDLYQIAEVFAPDVARTDVEPFEDALWRIQTNSAPEGSTFYHIDATEMSDRLEARIMKEISDGDGSRGVVLLDRYIGKNLDAPECFRLSVSRNADDQLVARPGAAPIADQITQLREWRNSGKYDELLLVDDVLAFGSTVPALVEQIKDGDDLSVRLLVGLASTGGLWSGIEKVEHATGIQTEYLVKATPSLPRPGITKGMAVPVSRDFTVFGGKAGRAGEQAVTYPYLFPFSKPGSMVDAEVRIASAYDLLRFNRTFLRFLGKVAGRSILVEDIQRHFSSVPYTNIPVVAANLAVPDHQKKVTKFLRDAQVVLSSHLSEILAESA